MASDLHYLGPHTTADIASKYKLSESRIIKEEIESSENTVSSVVQSSGGRSPGSVDMQAYLKISDDSIKASMTSNGD